MSSEHQVAIVQSADFEAAVQRGVALIGGMERFVRPGADVIVKVNMFTRATPESAKVTHPGVVLAIARLCRDCGGQVTVVERHAHYDLIFQGYEEIRDVAQLVALEQVEHEHRRLPGAKSLVDQVPWPTLLDRCDVFINIPGLRTHALTKMSNGMKNLMGLLPDDATRLVHHYGLDGSICDLNAYRPSDLVITDAFYTLEGNFPSEGSPVTTDLITVATNVVAADLVAAKLMGMPVDELHYLREAIQRGMGPASLDQLSILGDDLETLAAAMQIEHAPRNPEAHRGPYQLYLGDMCDSCRQALAGGLLAVSHNQQLADVEGVAIVAGHQREEPYVGQKRVLLYGNCAYPYRHLGHYEPGCPPLAGQVGKGVNEIRPRTISASMCSIGWRNEPIESVVPIVAEAGYLGLEAWGPHVERYVGEHGELASLSSLLKEHGLQVPMISAYFDLDRDLEGSLEAAQRYVGFARDLEAPMIRVFTGGGDSEQASISCWRRVVSGLGQICALGAEHGIAFALETHAGHLHDTTATTLRLLRQTGMPNLCVNLDIYNLFAIGENPIQALKRLFPWVRHVHLKNRAQATDDGPEDLPLAEGDMDFGEFLLALVDLNYGGHVSLEWFGNHPAKAARREIAYLQAVFGDTLCILERPAERSTL